MRRRRFLALASSSLAAVAGCSAADQTATRTPDPTPTPTPTGTPTPTPTASETGTEPPEAETVVEAGELLVDAMAAGEFGAAHDRFAARAQGQTSPGAIEAVWLGHAAVAGAFDRVAGTEEVVQSGFDGVDLTLAFERGEHVLRVLVDDERRPIQAVVNDEYRCPGYVDPESFAAREANVETEECVMTGTATVPETDGDAPGVVLVHGSDPAGGADKDLTTIGSKPFKDLAEGLATQGVAALRYDRRTHACPGTVPPSEYTLDAVSVGDALGAIERLRSVDGVDPERIVVVGLSLGGLAVPRIAARDGDLAGAVAMAAPARSFHDIFVDQYEHLATVGEFEWERMAELYERWQDRIERIREGDYAASDVVLGYPGALWNSLDAYDHVGTARDLETPLLFLQGQRDYQVSPTADFGRWREALGGSGTVEFAAYDGLNHVFQFGEGPSVPTEYTLRNPVDERVVADVAAWVSER